VESKKTSGLLIDT